MLLEKKVRFRTTPIVIVTLPVLKSENDPRLFFQKSQVGPSSANQHFPVPTF